jgi:hypothetical protein
MNLTSIPKCKTCKQQMVDARVLMMGVRFRCPKNHTCILQHQWDEKKQKIIK